MLRHSDQRQEGEALRGHGGALRAAAARPKAVKWAHSPVLVTKDGGNSGPLSAGHAHEWGGHGGLLVIRACTHASAFPSLTVTVVQACVKEMGACVCVWMGLFVHGCVRVHGPAHAYGCARVRMHCAAACKAVERNDAEGWGVFLCMGTLSVVQPSHPGNNIHHRQRLARRGVHAAEAATPFAITHLCRQDELHTMHAHMSTHHKHHVCGYTAFM